MQNTLYFVETGSREQRLLLCRWVEHFYEKGERIQVLTDSTTAAQHLDQLLWSFSQPSFIPHRIWNPQSREDPEDPVIVTPEEFHLEGYSTLVCDTRVSISFLKEYQLAVHFVLMDDPERRRNSRLLYQEAREQNVRLKHVPHNANLPC